MKILSVTQVTLRSNVQEQQGEQQQFSTARALASLVVLVRLTKIVLVVLVHLRFGDLKGFESFAK